MATDFTYSGKTITTSGGIKPSGKNTPADIRTRVNTKADISSIPSPFVGMHIVVLQDETNSNKMTEYVVKSLKANSLGVADTVINEVVTLKEFLEVQEGTGTGIKGDKGDPGVTPNITIGTVTTLESGQQATVTRRGTTENPIFDFGIPKGVDGVGGGTGTIPANIEPNDNDVPKIFFTSDEMLSLSTKGDGERIVEFEYISKTKTFRSFATVAIQGTSSAGYPKKNYTLKLYKDKGKTEKEYIDLKGWGRQTKFCLKANYVDTTHTRNIAGARIGYDMVESRPASNFKTSLQSAPRNGLVDGFPIKVFVNGVFHGIYTWNIPKDDWQFNNPQMVLCAEYNNDGILTSDNQLMCEFRKEWTTGSAWSVEAGELTTELRNSFNRCVNFVMTSSDEEFKTNIGQYFDLYSLLDYYCFSYLCCHLDGLAKNMLMITYNGIVWGASLYDMDSIFGASTNGGSFVSYDYQCPEQYQETNSLLWQRLENCFAKELYARYKELRKGALSLGNIVSHVEHIYDLITDRDLLEERRKWTSLPSASTNTIERFRNYMQKRAEYVDGEFELFNTEPVPVTRIIFDKLNTSVNIGSTETIKVTYEPDNTTQKALIWESSDTSKATVTNGVITGVAVGTCNITAKSFANNDITATCSVTVKNEVIAIQSLKLNKTTSSLIVGESEQLQATIEPSNANKSVTWESSDDNKATVVNGLVTAKAKGEVIITCTSVDGSKTATCTYVISENIEITSYNSMYNIDLNNANLKTVSNGSNVNIINVEVKLITFANTKEVFLVDKIDTIGETKFELVTDRNECLNYPNKIFTARYTDYQYILLSFDKSLYPDLSFIQNYFGLNPHTIHFNMGSVLDANSYALEKPVVGGTSWANGNGDATFKTLVACNEGETYRIISTGNWCGLYTFDENKNFISLISDKNVKTQDVVIPSGVKYITVKCGATGKYGTILYKLDSDGNVILGE